MHKFLIHLFLSVLIFTSKDNLYAQPCSYTNIENNCINPNLASPFYNCQEREFHPVCACDGNTYRNICEATCKYGILIAPTTSDVTCSGFEIDIYPNIIGPANNINFCLVQSTETASTLVVTDVWGKIVMLRNLPPQYRVEWAITDGASFPQGAYILFVYNQRGDYRYKRFVKVSL